MGNGGMSKRNSSRLHLQQVVRTPHSVCKQTIEFTALIKVGFLEVWNCTEWQFRIVDEPNEAGIAVKTIWVERVCKKVLRPVMWQLILVGEIAVTGIEGFG